MPNRHRHHLSSGQGILDFNTAPSNMTSFNSANQNISSSDFTSTPSQLSPPPTPEDSLQIQGHFPFPSDGSSSSWPMTLDQQVNAAAATPYYTYQTYQNAVAGPSSFSGSWYTPAEDHDSYFDYGESPKSTSNTASPGGSHQSQATAVKSTSPSQTGDAMTKPSAKAPKGRAASKASSTPRPRRAHNLIERDYRQRLNSQIQDLAAVVLDPSSLSSGIKPSKTLVISRAKEKLLRLESANVDMGAEVDQLRERVAALEFALARARAEYGGGDVGVGGGMGIGHGHPGGHGVGGYGPVGQRYSNVR